MKKVRTIVGVALLAVAAVLAYFHFYGKARIDEEIKKALASLPEGWSVEYKSIDYAVSSDLLIIEGLKVKAPSEPPVDVTIEKIEAEGVSLSTVQDLINGVDNATEFKPLAKSLTLGKLAFDGPVKYTFSSDRYVATNIAIKPWPKMSGSLTTEQILRLLHSYSIEKEEMEGIKSKLTLFKDIPPSIIEIAKAVSTLHADGKIDRFDVTGMTMDGATVSGIPGQTVQKLKMTIGSSEMNKVDYSGFMRALVEGKTSSAMSGGFIYENLIYRDVSYVLVDMMEAAVKEIAVKDTKYDQGIPTGGTMTFNGMTLIPQQAEMKKAFADLEYAEPPAFDGEMFYVYDPADKRLEMNDFRMSADNVGTLTMTAKFSGIDIMKMNEELMENPDDSQRLGQEMIEKMNVIGLNLRYEDKSLVERIYKAAAKQDGRDVEEVKQEAVMGVMFLGGMMAQGSEDLVKLFETVAAFLQEPRSIALTMTPATPLPLGERAVQEFAGKQPGEIIEMLGLSLTANQ